MLASEEILEERRAAYEDQQRIFLARLMSEKGGLCMKDARPEESEAKAAEYFKNMAILDMKYVDIVREKWGLDPADNSATFGEDMEKMWDHFIKNHVLMNDKGEPTILYTDKDNNYRLIPGKFPFIKDLGFVIDRFDKIMLSEDEEKDVSTLPSVTIMGVEALCSEKYKDYILEPGDSNFYVSQVMMLAGELLDVIKEHRTELKESGNELFKELEQKYKEVF